MEINISAARVGGVRSNFPGIKLYASPDELTLKVPLLGAYKFTPGDIISFEDNKGLYGANVFINHNVLDYPQKLSLDYKGGAQALTLMLNKNGFTPKGMSGASLMRKGVPARWSFLIAAVVLWNALLIYGKLQNQFTLYSLIAIAAMLLITIFLPRSEALQKLALKDGRRIGEIKPTLNLLKLVAALILVATLISSLLK
jgi:hypothetical protein